MDMSTKKKVLSTAMALTASLAMVTGASAAEVSDTGTQDVQFEIEGGDLTLTTKEINSFETINLGELEEKGNLGNSVRGKFTTSFVEPYEITDARGTGEGYHLTVSATNFTEIMPEESTDDPLVLSTGTLTLDADSLTSITRPGGEDGGEMTPTNELLDGAIIDGESAVTVLNAEVGTGLGDWELNFSDEVLKLNIDVTLDTYIDAKNYGDKDLATPFESTLTWNLVSAPQ